MVRVKAEMKLPLALEPSKSNTLLGLSTVAISLLIGGILPYFAIIFNAMVFSFKSNPDTAGAAILIHYGLLIAQIFLLVFYIEKKITPPHSVVNTWLPLILFSMVHIFLTISCALLRSGILYAFYN